jgi:hypothetical protein
LESLLPELACSPIPLFLETAFLTTTGDLGEGDWVSAGELQWRIPVPLPAAFLRSQAITEGNCAIYQRDSVLEHGLPQGLPWWGRAASSHGRRTTSPESIIDGLAQAMVESAVVVHPDATDLVTAIPGLRNRNRTA